MKSVWERTDFDLKTKFTSITYQHCLTNVVEISITSVPLTTDIDSLANTVGRLLPANFVPCACVFLLIIKNVR